MGLRSEDEISARQGSADGMTSIAWCASVTALGSKQQTHLIDKQQRGLCETPESQLVPGGLQFPRHERDPKDELGARGCKCDAKMRDQLSVSRGGDWVQRHSRSRPPEP